MVQVEGFASEDLFPLRDGDITGGSRGNLDLVPASWNVLEVGSQVFAGLDATCRQCKEGSTVRFIPGKVDGSELPFLPGAIGIVRISCM